MKYTVKNASITLGTNTILDYVNIDINDNDHIGIVGRNGAGKTTLLKALINNDLFEEGYEDEPFAIRKIGSFSIGYQSQITFNDEEKTLIEEVEGCFQNLLDMEIHLEELLTKMEEDSSDEIIKEYTETLDNFEYLGGYTYKKEYEIMLKKFGFTEEEKNKPIKSFSGGERTKIAFIKLLLSKPDLLFLDEPTNHLDLEAIEWLEDYLKDYKGAFIVVSHDRMFLNNVVNIIYDISNGRTTKYVGNYDNYQKKREEEYVRALKNYEKQQDEIKRLKELYLKFRNKPTKAAMALSKLHKIEQMTILDRPEKIDERTFRTNLDKMRPSTKRVLLTKNLEVGYDKTLANLNFEVRSGDRVGIIGANGTGKSTLLKTLYGLLEPKKGSISYGQNLDIAYFDQNLAMTSSKNTVLEEFELAHPELNHQESRSALGSFLFRGDDVFKTIDVLSGGEKVRLSLCKILFDKPNVLILDEPTNHMDIIGKKRLEDILKAYKGTVIFVSHDRYFVREIATSLIVFENGEAKYYNYGYKEYLEKRTLPEVVVEELAVIKDTRKKEKKNETPKTNTYNTKRELNKIESDIIRLENKKKKLTEQLSDPNIYTDYIKSRELNDELKKLEIDLEALSSKWDELAKDIT